MLIILSIYSKNSNSLTNFLKLLYKLEINKTLNLKLTIYQCQQFKTCKVFSTLKSPHVNKKAQEQFEFRRYKKQLKIHVLQLTTFLAIFKTVKSSLFTDINTNIDFLVNKNPFKNRLISKASSDKFFKKFIKNNIQPKYTSVKLKSLTPNKSLLILDICGEFLLKAPCLDSSVG